MKRSLAKNIAIVALIIVTALPASAEKQMIMASSSEKATRREAFEFYGLYIKRRMELCDYIDYSSETYAATVGNVIASLPSDPEMTIVTPAGMITIRPSDHTVSEVSDRFFSLGWTNDERDKHLVNALAILSALEYGSMEEIEDSFARKRGDASSRSAAEKIASLYANELGAIIYSTIYNTSEKETLIYSGNYDYYLRLYTPSDGEEVYFFVARAKE